MNYKEKAFARIKFQNKIYSSDGQAFEDLFVSIMNYKNQDFTPIKPWGNIGDRKSDGYIPNQGIYYQVYAPEDIRKSYSDTINKLNNDFEGLKTHWSNHDTGIKEFYFVVNDKYKGINADCEKTIKSIEKVHKLKKAAFLIAKHLEDWVFKLDEDQIEMIISGIPDPNNLKRLDYSILDEVIKYIMSLSITSNIQSGNQLPDWDEKIKFNNLSDYVSNSLIHGSYQLNDLNKYLKNNSNYLADELQKKLLNIYKEEKIKSKGDKLFWSIVNRISARNNKMYQESAIVILSKYFETCDIFEYPEED